MKLSTKASFQDALKSAERDLNQMFIDMQRELAGLLVSAAGDDGKIRPQDSEALRAKARLLVEKYFIRYKVVSGSEKQAESERLHEMMTLAQKQMKGATFRQQNELKMRVILISKRLALLDKHSVIVETIDAKGAGVSRFAKIITNGDHKVVKAALNKQREVVQSIMSKVKA